MSFIQLNGIHLAFADRDILSDVNLQLNEKSRAAIAGGNGCGKSSLLKIIAGIIQPDTGRINTGPECRISYLPQWGIEYTGSNIIEEAGKAFNYLSPLLTKKSDLEQKLAEISDGDPATERLLHKHHSVEEKLQNAGYYRKNEQIKYVLQGLGFKADDFTRNCSEFSGGWQMRIALSKVLLSEPHILLLDEPTNYLDLEARNWLEIFFTDFSGGIAVVSHDRYFLDTTVNETIEIFNGKAKRYRCNYSAYEKKRVIELSTLMDSYEKQAKEISKIEDFIQRFRSNASKASLVQSRVNQLERINRIEIPENFKKIHFAFPPAPHSGQVILTVENLCKAYGENQVFKNLDVTITKGERLVVTGINGAGKSTFLKILTGKDTGYEGEVKTGTDVKVGYFAQDSLSQVNKDNSIIKELEESAPTSLIPMLRDILGGFLFRGDDIHKSISVLSGGEISRICLIKLLLQDINVLVLDEPTNHLDIHSKDILLDALKQFSGTIIFVSHDRYFIENLADRVLEIENGMPSLFPGDYKYYLWKKEQDKSGTEQFEQSRKPEKQTDSKIERELLKKRNSRIKKLQRTEETLLLQIDELEQEQKTISEKLTLPEVYSNHEKAAEIQKEINKINANLEELHDEWHKASEELEAVQSE